MKILIATIWFNKQGKIVMTWPEGHNYFIAMMYPAFEEYKSAIKLNVYARCP